jgi:hypothetical protein
MSQTSVDQIAAAIAQFEQSTNFKDIRKFHIAQAVAFKDRLQRHINPETGRALAKATIHSRLMALEGIHDLAGGPTRLPVADWIFRRRLFEPFGQ